MISNVLMPIEDKKQGFTLRSCTKKKKTITDFYRSNDPRSEKMVVCMRVKCPLLPINCIDASWQFKYWAWVEPVLGVCLGRSKEQTHSGDRIRDLPIARDNVSSRSRLCSPHMLIRDDTFCRNWIFAKKRLNLYNNRRNRPWIACVECTGSFGTSLSAHA